MKSYVESIRDKQLTVICVDSTLITKLSQMGGHKKLFCGSKWKFNFKDNVELAGILMKLRDENVAMAGGSSGWPPAAVFEQLREEGQLSGGYTEIIWKTPNEFILNNK